MLSEMFDMFVQSFWETLVMVGISGLVGAALGLPLGVLLYLTDRDGVLQNLARESRASAASSMPCARRRSSSCWSR